MNELVKLEVWIYSLGVCPWFMEYSKKCTKSMRDGQIGERVYNQRVGFRC